METEKLSYTNGEIESLIHWFDGKTLPENMQIDKSSYTSNLTETVNRIIHMIEANKHSINLLGYVFLLERIKRNLTNSDKQ